MFSHSQVRVAVPWKAASLLVSSGMFYYNFFIAVFLLFHTFSFICMLRMRVKGKGMYAIFSLNNPSGTEVNCSDFYFLLTWNLTSVSVASSLSSLVDVRAEFPYPISATDSRCSFGPFDAHLPAPKQLRLPVFKANTYSSLPPAEDASLPTWVMWAPPWISLARTSSASRFRWPQIIVHLIMNKTKWANMREWTLLIVKGGCFYGWLSCYLGPVSQFAMMG